MAAAVEHRDRVADAEPQHARQVLGFVAAAATTVSSPGSSAGAKKRCTGGLYGSTVRVHGQQGRDQPDRDRRMYTRARGCSSAVRSSASTRSSRRSAAAASARSTSRKTPGSTRRSRSRFRTSRASTSASCCASRACSPALNHPNIVTILTAEKQDNVFFIVMEFVPGETLETIIARDGALDLPRALDYTCQICNAVDHAHRQGVLHRDLRPVERARRRQRHAEGRRLRHVALSRDRRARHDRDRQPAVHGARAVPRQGGVRVATSTRSASRCTRC